MCVSVCSGACVVCPKSGKKNNKQTEGEIKNLDRTNTLQRLAPALVIIIINMSLINSRRGPRRRPCSSRRVVVVLLHRGGEAAARGGWGAPD